MSLRSILHLDERPPVVLTESVRAVEDIRGVRVIRLRGPVGRTVALEAAATDAAAAKSEGVFGRPVLFDFGTTTECDSATVAYLIQALRRRVPAHVHQGENKNAYFI